MDVVSILLADNVPAFIEPASIATELMFSAVINLDLREVISAVCATSASVSISIVLIYPPFISVLLSDAEATKASYPVYPSFNPILSRSLLTLGDVAYPLFNINALTSADV